MVGGSLCAIRNTYHQWSLGIRHTGNNVLLGAKQVADGNLLDVGKVLLELITQGEGDDWQSSIVVCASLVVPSVAYFALLEFKLALRSGEVSNFHDPGKGGHVELYSPVDIRNATEPTGGFEGLGQQASVCQCVLHDVLKTFETKMDQVVVLCDDLRAGAREV